MGKNDTQKRTRKEASKERERTNTWAEDFGGRARTQSDYWGGRASGGWDETLGMARDIWNTPLTDPGYARFTGRYGGLDPAMVKRVQGDAGALRNFASYGGVDAEGRSRMRGGGYFDELIKSGGYSDEDIANIRARTARQTPALYEGLRSDLERGHAAQGGYGPGYDAQLAKLTRDSARASQDAILGSEIGLAESIRGGKLAGASGMSDAERALQALISQNTLGGYTSAAGIEGNLMDSIRSGQMFGVSGLGDLDKTNLARRLSAAGILSDLTGMAGGFSLGWGGLETDAERIRSGANASLLDIFGRSRDKSWWETWGRDVFGAGASIAGAAAGGG